MASIYRAIFVALLISFCSALCSSANDLPCSGKGTCVSDQCVCNIGFSGEDCSFESYRNFKYIQFDGSQQLQLIQKDYGGDSEFVQPVFRFDLQIKIESYHDANIFRMSNGDIDTISISLDLEGKITYRAMCYGEELGRMVSDVSVPLGRWVSITIFHNGTFDRNFVAPTSYAYILMDGAQAGSSSQVLIPRRLARPTQVVGENFQGKIALFQSWNYVSTTPLLGTCLTTKVNRITHDCDFDALDQTACGALTDDLQFDQDPSALLNRFDIDLYVWSSASQKSWYFPVHHQSAQDALINSAVQRGLKRLYVNNYCVTPAPGTCFDDSTMGQRIRRWDPKSLALLIQKAHAAGLQVFALYTDMGPMGDVRVHNNRAKSGTKIDGVVIEAYDGIAMDYEPAFTQVGADSLFNTLNATKALGNELGIPVHASISWVWSDKTFLQGPAYKYVFSAFGEGDSIDIQPGSKWHCDYERRTRSIIREAKSKGMRAYVTLETRSDFNTYSFNPLGETAIWKEIRNSFLLDDESTTPNGFVLHHYGQSINFGNSSWTAVGMTPNCPGGVFDFKGDCVATARSNECGDGFCDPVRGESSSTCPQDCPSEDCHNINARSVCETTYANFEPITEEPTEVPTTETPTTTAAPTTQVPTTVRPTTLAPTTKVPTTSVPTTRAPTTVAPTTKPPTCSVNIIQKLTGSWVEGQTKPAVQYNVQLQNPGTTNANPVFLSLSASDAQRIRYGELWGLTRSHTQADGTVIYILPDYQTRWSGGVPARGSYSFGYNAWGSMLNFKVVSYTC